MIITLDKKGFLKVDGKLKKCPFSERLPVCGSWCALFGEPFARFPVNGEPEKKDRICICNGKTLISQDEIKREEE